METPRYPLTPEDVQLDHGDEILKQTKALLKQMPANAQMSEADFAELRIISIEDAGVNDHYRALVLHKNGHYSVTVDMTNGCTVENCRPVR